MPIDETPTVNKWLLLKTLINRIFILSCLYYHVHNQDGERMDGWVGRTTKVFDHEQIASQ